MKEKYLPIITKSSSVCVAVSDIVKIQRNGRKLEVETEDGSSYAYYEKIENVAGYLDDRFYACLSGCIINMEKVRSMKDLIIRFTNGNELIVGRDSFIKARRRYNEYALKNRALTI